MSHDHASTHRNDGSPDEQRGQSKPEETLRERMSQDLPSVDMA